MTSTLTLKELARKCRSGSHRTGWDGTSCPVVDWLEPTGGMFSSSSRMGTIPFIYDSFTWQFTLAAGA